MILSEQISQYDIKETYFYSQQFTLCGSVHKKTLSKYILHVFRSSSDDRSMYEKALSINKLLKRVKTPKHITTITQVDEWSDYVILTGPSKGGISLKQLLASNQLDITDRLRLAIRIAEGVECLHAAGLVHNNINPLNVLVVATTLEPTLTNYRHLGIHNAPMSAQDGDDYSQKFVAPEYTLNDGPITCTQQGDLYSLGVILYYLFEKRDSNKTSNFFGTTKRQQSSAYDFLTKSIEACLMRDPTHRTQSIDRVLVDLQHCLSSLEQTVTSISKNATRPTIEAEITLSRKLYGREKELSTILEGYTTALTGQTSFISIVGENTVGKTLLCQRAKEALKKNGAPLFLDVDFSKLQRGNPIDLLIQAFSGPIDTITNLPSSQLQYWQSRFNEYLAPHAAFFRHYFPKTDILFTESTSDGSRIDAEEIQPDSILQLLRCLSSPDASYCLVACLDNFHIADPRSIAFIGNLLSAAQSSENFLALLLYPPHEENEKQLENFIAQAFGPEANYQWITLKPLTEFHILQLLQDSFDSTQKSFQVLAKLIQQKTDGNPRYVKEFLHQIIENKLIQHDTATNRWTWDTEALSTANVTENVVEKLCEAIKHQPSTLTGVLNVCACFDSDFSYEEIAQVCDIDRDQLSLALEDALNLGYLYIQNSWRSSETTSDDFPTSLGSYQFSHSQIRNIVYQSLEADFLTATHYKIAKQYIALSTPAQNVVRHINLGAQLFKENGENATLFSYNLRTAHYFATQGEHKNALTHYNHAINYMNADAWHSDYEQTLELYNNTCIQSGLLGDKDSLRDCYQAILGNTTETFQRTTACKTMMRYLRTVNRSDEATALGLNFLSSLEEAAKPSVSTFQSTLLIVKTMVSVFVKGSSIYELEELDDKRLLAASDIMHDIAGDCYFSNPLLFSTLVCRLINIALTRGMSKYALIAFSTTPHFALKFIDSLPILFSPRWVRRFSNIAENLKHLHESDSADLGTDLFYNLHLRGWLKPIATTQPHWQALYVKSQEFERSEFGLISNAVALLFSHAQGSPLRDLEEVIKERFPEDEHFTGNSEHQLSSIQWWFIRGVRDQSLPDNALTYINSIQQCTAQQLYEQHPIIPFAYYQFKGLFNFLDANYQAANRYYELANEYAAPITGLPVAPDFYTQLFLAKAACCRNGFGVSYQEIGECRERIIAKLSKWLIFCEANVASKIAIINAEYISLGSTIQSADELYMEAIEKAHASENLKEVAIFRECYAIHCLSRNTGLVNASSEHLQQAYTFYNRWGAYRASRRLQAEWGMLLKNDFTVSRSIPRYESSGHISQDYLSELLSLNQDTDYGGISRNLIGMLIAKTGVTRAFVVIQHANRRVVYAADGEEISQDTDILEVPLDNCNYLPRSIIQWVCSNGLAVDVVDGNEHLLQDNETFRNDEYIVSTRIKGLLCHPIKRGTRILGAIYIDNIDTPALLTEETVKQLETIATIGSYAIYGALSNETLDRTLNTLNAVVENSTDGFWQLKLDKDGNVIHFDANPALLLNFRIPDDENLTNLNLFESVFAHKDDLSNVQETLLNHGGIEDYEAEMARLDGTVFWGSFSASYEYLESGVSVYNGRVTDITSQVVTSSNDTTNNKRSEFIARLTHEIRTPMGATLGFIDLAMNEKDRGKKQDSLAKAKLSGENLLRFLNDVSDFSKIENGSLEFERRIFKVEDLIDNVSVVFELESDKTGIPLKIDYHPDPDQDYYLIGDNGRINQILINLLSNAFKFTHSGEITLSLEISPQSDSQCRLSGYVKDTGIGIDDNDKEYIFQQYAQSDESWTRKYGGTGIGLTIARSLAENMHGNITFESAVGEGTTFYFHMTLALGTAQQHDSYIKQVIPSFSSSSDSTKLSGKLQSEQPVRVLVVDDDKLNQQLYMTTLSQMGVDVQVAVNGAHAISILRQKEFDLVFMDIAMPHVNGFEATKQIRDNLKLNKLVIVALTANVGEGIRKECLASGMDAYLAKPCSYRDFFTCLTQYIDGTFSNRATLHNHEFNASSLNIPELSVIDFKQLAQHFNSDLDAYDFLEKLHKWFSNFQDIIDKHHQNSDVSALRSFFHNIKSHSRTVGFDQLSDESARIENILKDGEFPAATSLIENFHENMAVLMTDIEHLLEVNQLNEA